MPSTRSRSDTERIVTALGRLRTALAERPGFGRSTSTATATLGEGLSCPTTERTWEIECDLGPALGGDASGPSPTTLVRAALASCLAMGYRLRAAELGIELTAVRVTVETESALRGMLIPDCPDRPGFTAVRYHVAIESPDPPDDVRRVVEIGDALSPVLDAIARPHHVERTITIGTGA